MSEVTDLIGAMQGLGNDIRRITSVHGNALEVSTGSAFAPGQDMVQEVANAITKTRFGRQIIIEPTPGEPLDCAAASNLTLVHPAMLFPQTIIRISAEDLQRLSYLPGAWVLTIDSRPVDGEASPHYPGTFLANSMIAKVTFGTGAAAHTLEIDAVGNSITLPAMDVNVDVGLSQICGLTNGVQPVGLYKRYAIRAVLHKVGGEENNDTTKTIIVNAADPYLAVPPFATSWCYVANRGLAFGELITDGSGVGFRDAAIDIPAAPPFPQLIEGVEADIVASNTRNHCYRPLHPYAKAIQLHTLAVNNPPEADVRGSLVFRIAL